MWSILLAGMVLSIMACGGDKAPGEGSEGSATGSAGQEEDTAQAQGAMMTGNQNIYKLIPRHSKLCLGMPNAGGAEVQQLTCNQHNNDSGNYYYQTQDWWLQPAGPAGSNLYEIHSRALDRCLAVQNASTSSGAAVVREACTGGAHQIFKLEQGGEGRYKLIAKHSGMCLDINGGPSATGSGAGLVQTPCTTDASLATSQRFYLAARLYQYKWTWGPKIYPKLTQGTTLFRGTVTGWPGDIVHSGNGGSDLWYSAQEGDGTIRFTSWAGYRVMSVKGGSTDDGALYEINDGNGAAYQQFYLNASLTDSSYQLVAKHSDKCAYATPAPESKVRQASCDREAADQRFYIPFTPAAVPNACSRAKLTAEAGNAAPIAQGTNYWPAGENARILTLDTGTFAATWVPVLERDANRLASLNVKAIRLVLNSPLAGWPDIGGSLPVDGIRPGDPTNTQFTNVKENLPTLLKIFQSRNIQTLVVFAQNHLNQGYVSNSLRGENSPPPLCWDRAKGCKPRWEYMREYEPLAGQPLQGIYEFIYDAVYWVRETILAVESDPIAKQSVLAYDIFNEVDFDPFFNYTTSNGAVEPTVAHMVRALWDGLQGTTMAASEGKLGFSILRTQPGPGAPQGDHAQLALELGPSRIPAFVDFHSYEHAMPVRSSGSVAPLHYWAGEGTAVDSTGTANGTLAGSTTYGPAKVGQGFVLDGNGDTVTFQSPGSFGAADFSIDFWIQTTSTRNEGIIGRRPVCGHSHFLDVRMNNGNLSVEIDDNNINYNWVASSVKVNDGNFHHVAITRKGVSLSLFIDGVLNVTKSSAGVTDVQNAGVLVAGKSVCTNDGATFFTGKLDELRIWGRALPVAEIQQIVGAGSAGICAVSPLTCAAGYDKLSRNDKLNPNVAQAYQAVKAAFPSSHVVVGELGHQRGDETNGGHEEDLAANSLCQRIRAVNALPMPFVFNWTYQDDSPYSLVRPDGTPTDSLGVYADLFGLQKSDESETSTWSWSCRPGQTCPASCSDCGGSPRQIGEFASAVDQHFRRFSPSYVVDTLVPGPGVNGVPNAFPLDAGDQFIYVSGFLRPSTGAVVTITVVQLDAAGAVVQESTMTPPLADEYRWQQLLTAGSQRVARAPGATQFVVKLGKPSLAAAWYDLDAISVNAQ